MADLTKLTVRTRDLFRTPDDGPDQEGTVYDPACVEAMVAAVGETLTIPVNLTMKAAGDPSRGIVTMGLTVDTGPLQDRFDEAARTPWDAVAAGTGPDATSSTSGRRTDITLDDLRAAFPHWIIGRPDDVLRQMPWTAVVATGAHIRWESRRGRYGDHGTILAYRPPLPGPAGNLRPQAIFSAPYPLHVHLAFSHALAAADEDHGLWPESRAAFDRWHLEFGPQLPAIATSPSTQENTDERQ